MSSFFNELKDQIDRGRKGFHRGIPVEGVGMDKLSRHLGGIQPARYDVLGGNTGVGKTAFADLFYVIGPLYYLYQRIGDEFDYNIIYNSLEISRAKKLAKLACALLYLTEGIVVDWKTLLSYGTTDVLSDEMVAKVDGLEKIIDFMESKITFLTGFVNPTRIFMHVEKVRAKHGVIRHRRRGVGTKWEEGKAPKDEHGRVPEDYIQQFFPHPQYERLIVQVITDHIGLLSPEKEVAGGSILLTDKKLIDRHSKYRVSNRDDFDVSSVDISQFNREISELNRRRFEELTPQLEDFKGTGDPSENADTVIALFNPERYNMLTYRKYDLKRMPKRFRAGVILKDRNGSDMHQMGFRFIGECGHFAELPDATVLKEHPNLYPIIMDLRNKTLYDLLI